MKRSFLVSVIVSSLFAGGYYIPHPNSGSYKDLKTACQGTDTFECASIAYNNANIKSNVYSKDDTSYVENAIKAYYPAPPTPNGSLWSYHIKEEAKNARENNDRYTEDFYRFMAAKYVKYRLTQQLAFEDGTKRMYDRNIYGLTHYNIDLILQDSIKIQTQFSQEGQKYLSEKIQEE